jgi:hypothetical protein
MDRMKDNYQNYRPFQNSDERLQHEPAQVKADSSYDENSQQASLIDLILHMILSAVNRKHFSSLAKRELRHYNNANR